MTSLREDQLIQDGGVHDGRKRAENRGWSGKAPAAVRRMSSASSSGKVVSWER